MREVFLHYVWRFKLFDVLALVTEHGEAVEIIQGGYLNRNAGPDFLEAELIIGKEHWIGSIEMHLRSSDWDVHNHSNDRRYLNVILHVVWEHDKEIEGLRERNVQTLVLKDFVFEGTLERYQHLMQQPSSLPCAQFLSSVQWDKIELWFERLMVERMEEKLLPIHELALKTHFHWEEILFKLLAHTFGLTVNTAAFDIWSSSFPFSVFKKIQQRTDYIEALFFGQAGFLTPDAVDDYKRNLFINYQFLKRKYNLTPIDNRLFRFSKMRPFGFPTIRIAQLAGVYSQHSSLFQEVIQAKTLTEFESIFGKITISPYWLNHYRFEQLATPTLKQLSVAKIHNILINTIFPLQYYYHRFQQSIDIDQFIQQFRNMKAEKNSVLLKMKDYGFENKDAYTSQVLLHLKKAYCDEKKCLNCAIGNQILRHHE